jgi:hypothetical protein
MYIEIGPVSAASARAWIAYATEMVALLRALPEPHLPAPALEGFVELLDEWRPLADHEEAFRWSGDTDPARAKFLLNSLYRAGLIIEAEAEAGHATLRPAAADEFHFLLVHEVLEALEKESEADAQFVEGLRSVWGVARRA